jgi:hypothetical protein
MARESEIPRESSVASRTDHGQGDVGKGGYTEEGAPLTKEGQVDRRTKAGQALEKQEQGHSAHEEGSRRGGEHSHSGPQDTQDEETHRSGEGRIGTSRQQSQRRDDDDDTSQQQDPAVQTEVAYGMASVTHALQGINFPVSRQELIEQYGEREISWKKSDHRRLREYFENATMDEYHSMSDLTAAIAGNRDLEPGEAASRGGQHSHMRD